MDKMRDIYQYYNNFEKYKDVKSNLVINGKVTNPELSIFVPTYKRASTLEVTLKSVINQQTNVVYEIIIVNNDPEEGYKETKELLEGFNDERIYYYVNEQNIGLCGNWNRGIELSRGSYVTMIHDDDLLSPYFVENMIKAINDSKAGIIGVNYYGFRSDSLPAFARPQKLNYRNVTKESFFFGRNINIAGITVKKELMFSLGGYSEEYYPNEDTNLIYQAIVKDKVINIEHPLAGYRKEINLSLNDGTMTKIIMIMEETRRNIAKHEKFAERWMGKYDKEYLYTYIQGANTYWRLKIDYSDIFTKFGFRKNEPSKFKLFLMKIELKIKMLGGKI